MKFDADILEVRKSGRDRVIITVELQKDLVFGEDANHHFYHVHPGHCVLIQDE